MKSITLDDYMIPCWDHEKSWEQATAHPPLDDSWLRDQLDRFSGTIKILGPIRGSRDYPPFKDLAEGAFAIFGGKASASLKDLLKRCIELEFVLPSTRSKIKGDNEPCGPIAIAHNLAPEWIRHFWGALYNKEEFTNTLGGREFFPFENRDHLVHSLNCSFLGQVCLGIPVSNRLKRQILSLENNRSSEPPTNLFDALVQVYKAKHENWFQNNTCDTIAETWLKKAWVAVSLWHDAGYDAATWYLLSSKEFMHCRTVALNEASLKNALLKILTCIQNGLRGTLCPSLSKEIRNAQIEIGKPRNRLYDVLWYLDGCYNHEASSRTWGRLHAVFSAYEFLFSFKSGDRQREDVKHLAAAIAEHHEQFHMSKDANEWDNLWKIFLRNPMASVLAFADYLAAFERTKVEEPSDFIGADIGLGTGRMSFDMNINSDPLWITHEGSNLPLFFRGRRIQFRKPERYSLWGIIEKAEKSKVKSITPLKKHTCPFFPRSCN
jgi:hypothetical protein